MSRGKRATVSGFTFNVPELIFLESPATLKLGPRTKKKTKKNQNPCLIFLFWWLRMFLLFRNIRNENRSFCWSFFIWKASTTFILVKYFRIEFYTNAYAQIHTCATSKREFGNKSLKTNFYTGSGVDLLTKRFLWAPCRNPEIIVALVSFCQSLLKECINIFFILNM